MGFMYFWFFNVLKRWGKKFFWSFLRLNVVGKDVREKGRK